MLDAYLDESGIHDGAKVCVIAGYFSGHGRWKKFESEWKKLLAKFQVPMEKFRAKNLVPNKGGFFASWTKSKHVQFINAVAETIADQERIRPISSGLIVDDFYSFPENVRRYFTGAEVKQGKGLTTSGCPNKPYFVPFQQCVAKVAEYAPDGGKAHFFFGLDTSFAGYAGDLFKRIKESNVRWPWKDKMGDVSFPMAKEIPQLQAADFLVHLVYQHMVTGHGPIENRPPSPLLKLCIKNKRTNADFFFVTRSNMEQTLQVGLLISNPPPE